MYIYICVYTHEYIEHDRTLGQGSLRAERKHISETPQLIQDSYPSHTHNDHLVGIAPSNAPTFHHCFRP